MTRTQRVQSIGVVMLVAALMPAGTVLAQTTRPQGQQQATRPQGQQQTTRPQGQQVARDPQAQTPPAVRPGRAGGRGALPPVGPNMNQQQLQTWMDTYALVQAERDLQLTADQYPTFVGRLRRMQDVRRRQQMEKGRLLREMNGLLQGEGGREGARDEAILAHVKALDDLSQRTAAELTKAYQDLDTGLTPWQRGRYRMFEEQLERRKIELLSKINVNPGGGGSK